MVNDLDREGIECPVSKNDFNKIEKKINIVLRSFVMKIICFMLLMYQMKNLKLAWNENKSHYDYIRTKSTFASIAYSGLVKKEF